MVSVCVPVYNGIRYVGEQLGSILSQLGEGDEVVVSDDGSTDGTLEYVLALAVEDPRVRVVSHEKVPSRHAFDYTTHNVENAIRHSRGDVIVLAGKGHETYQEIRGVKYPFDEKQVVAELLHEMEG